MELNLINLKDVQNFAAKAHINIVRKYTGEPYIVHPIEVSTILKKYYPEATEEMIAAALLHDTVEDTDVTFDDIQTNFGLKVANLVYWLTDVSKPKDGNRAFRKNLDKEHTTKAPFKAQLIKCADIISNTSSIVKHDTGFAIVYLKEVLSTLESMLKTTKETKLFKTAYFQANTNLNLILNRLNKTNKYSSKTTD